MSVTAAKSSEWTGRMDSNVEVHGRDAPGSPYLAPTGYHWETTIHIIQRERRHFDISSFELDINTTLTGDNISIVNGDDILPGQWKHTYKCTDHQLEPDPPGSQMWRETQSWKCIYAWQEVRDGE